MAENQNNTEGLVMLEDVFETNPFAVSPTTEPENVQVTDIIDVEEDPKVSETDDKLADFLSDTTVNAEREKQDDKEEELVVIDDTKKVYAASLSSLGIETIVIEENGEEVEKKIEELDLTPELHNQILRDYIEQQKEEVSRNKISAEGVSDFLKKMIEIEQSGGDIKEFIKKNQNEIEIADPITQLDTTTEQGQIDVISMYLSANKKDSEEIEALIALWKTKGILESKAEEVKELVQKDLDAAAELEKEQAVKLKQEREDFLKTYKKHFKASLANFELNDTVKTKLTDFATKQGSDKAYALDAKLREMRLNPKKAAELALFVFDKDEYIKQVTNKVVVAEKLKTGTKIGTVKLRKSGSTDEFSATKVKDDADFVPL